MKKYGIIALILILALSLAACGRRNNEATSTPTTTGASVIPGIDPTIMDPTIGTNIPDPSVDTSMPDFTDHTDSTDTTNDTDNTSERSRSMH